MHQLAGDSLNELSAEPVRRKSCLRKPSVQVQRKIDLRTLHVPLQPLRGGGSWSSNDQALFEVVHPLIDLRTGQNIRP
jgi:hypothetical protein